MRKLMIILLLITSLLAEKICPQCKNTYPDHYRICPSCEVKLREIQKERREPPTINADIKVEGSIVKIESNPQGAAVYVNDTYKANTPLTIELPEGTYTIKLTYPGYRNYIKQIKIERPTSYEVGYYDTPDYARGVAVSGSYAYVADDEKGLRIINISNPSRPYEVGYYDTPGYAYGVAVSGFYAYVADGYEGLRIINISNPSRPYEVGYYNTLGYARNVAVSGSYVYVADGYAGLRIIRVR